MTNSNLKKAAVLVSVFSLLAGCGGSGGGSSPTPPVPVARIDVSGSILDGPVTGGTLFVFAADAVNAALADAADAEDRAAALAGAGPIVQLARDAADGANYTLDVGGALAGQAVFFVFDSAGAEDERFGDQPMNLEAVAVLGAAGSQMRVNLTPHTTLASIQVRVLLDPEGDGTVIDAAAVQSAADTALANALMTFGRSALGDDLLDGEDPGTSTDLGILGTASSEVGLAARAAGVASGASIDETMYLFAADAADGVLDGAVPVQFALDEEQAGDLAAVSAANALGGARDTDVEAVSCTGSTDAMRRACEFEAQDEFFTGVAICAHSGSDADAEACLEDYADERDEALEECAAVTGARQELCAVLADAPHDPLFGEDFAGNFVDPREIGAGVEPNPWFPMVQGSVWVYEGTFEEDGEMITEEITITVTDSIKLIDGILCRVVRDVVTVDGELVEDTDDWIAQDTDGNLWYCGEEAKDYEYFDGDEPAVAELVAIDGSFKAGREGDEAGILLPGTPVVGDYFRQEVSFGNAEDAIEILATDATEAIAFAVASCTGDCLQTRDFSPLEPDLLEYKYYKPGIGKVLEVEPETGTRFELVSVTIGP